MKRMGNLEFGITGCFLLPLLFLFLLTPGLKAQNPSAHSGVYLLPQTIFVGDPGRLVVPLAQVYAGVEPFVIESQDKLPQSPDMVIRRIELERRGGGSRLLIDFIPYAPGNLSLPPIELLSPEAGVLKLEGLQAQVASILNPSQMALSEPAAPLAVPGTSLLVYGSIILVLVLFFAGIGASLWGRRHFRSLWERFRRRHLIKVMAKFLRRLEQEGDLEKSGKANYYLTLLSGEFREFLSLFTGVNCRSLSSGEFMELPLVYGENSTLTPDFLCRLFRTWDTLRFSGRGVDKIDLFQALKATENFITTLDKAEREQPITKSLLKAETAAGPVEATEGGLG